MYEFMEKLWIPVTMYRLLSNLEDTIISSNVTARASWVDGAREIILHSILVDENNPEATLELDEELTDSERRAVRTIQARLLEFPIIFDNMNVSNRDLQNFRLLLDPVWYHAFITKILSKKAIRVHLPMPLIKLIAYLLETANGWVNKPAVINREKLFELAAKNWVCDISKARNELNFNPQYTLESGLKDTIEWYQQNKLL